MELWDSCGYDETNDVFMQLVCRYLYDINSHEQRQNQGTLKEWRLAWTCSDQLINSPMQGNNNDCRIFTLVLLALLSSGTRLRHNSYSQDIVYHGQPRQRIAYLIWKQE